MSQISDDSIFQEKNYHISPDVFASKNFIQNSSNFILTDVVNRYVGQNKSINVLEPKGEREYVNLNEEFIDYLRRSGDGNLVVVSVIGSKGIGKSFLLDSMISMDSEKTSRVMHQNKQQIVNTSTYNFKAKNDSRVQFFDVKGTTSKQNFFWLYTLSSVFVLNLNEIDEDSEEEYLRKFQYVNQRLKIDEPEDLTLPTLMIIRRDCQKNKPIDQSNFLNEIDKIKIFEPHVPRINLPYPSKTKIAQNKIANLPEMNIDDDFQDGVKKINKIIRNSNPKALKGNPFSSKLLLFTMMPVRDDINRHEKVEVDKLWKDTVDNFGQQYYNGYLREYNGRLQHQFSQQRPRKQYEIYRTLADVKRKTDKNYLGFQNLEGNPIFNNYHEKLQQTIKDQQGQIIDQNHAIVHEYNNQNCKEIMKDLNSKNYERLIDDYNKSSDFQYKKSDVLLDNFKIFLDDKVNYKHLEGQSDVSGKSHHLISLEKELKDLEEKVEREKSNILGGDKEEQIKKLRASIIEKQSQLAGLKKTQIVKKPANSEILDLEKQNNDLEEEIKKTENQAERMLIQKQKKIKDAKYQLESILRNENIELSKLQTRLKEGVVVRNAGTQGRDKVCCTIM